jgi:hypothetical protein
LGLSAITELETQLNKISDLQGVLKDFTVISALHIKIWSMLALMKKKKKFKFSYKEQK